MISIVIPVYKNTDLFLKNLESNQLFLKDQEIIIVNDYPDENIEQQVTQYKNVKYIQNSKNLGFAMTADRGIKEASHAYVMLLNSDVVLHDTSYLRALKHFENNTILFGVSFAQLESDGTTVGKNILYWKNGFLNHAKANNLDAGFNGWAEGGSCIIDKSKYEQIGGFDKLYSPFYWEDTDLSYRAWKAGFTVIFDPEIVVEHHHQSTINKYFDTSKIETVVYRNQFIFIWKNIQDGSLLLDHLTHLPIAVFIDGLIKGKKELFKGWVNALKHIPTIIGKRKKIARIRTDREILKLFI